ncbi:MAG: KpsF/GutQ family sugar-phosphate isomerase [Verrucomicrobiales bacterium]|nr:KpsF/GutQ family sugar-phosphate isomerase [Verrucomicrobiales bacterium]
MSHRSCAQRIFEIELDALEAVRKRIDKTFDQAVNTITRSLNKRGKIIVIGIGKSGNVGHKIAATLTSTGSTAVILNTTDALHGDIGIIDDGDIILALSYSGESEELINLLPVFKRFKVKTIAITGQPDSTLARHSDVILDISVPKEACPFNLAPTASTTATLVMGDALAMAILEARGFTEKDFARYHPAGAIGKALLVRVRDIMRTGGRNPVASQNLTVKSGLMVMTKARSGSVSIVNKKGRLVGIFTDGDLRRLIADDTDTLQLPLKKVMIRNPMHIEQTALAAEALRIFDQQHIDDLIVVNSRQEPVGLLDSQDLPKLKLM